MILPDANLILYAHNQADPEHRQALRWWKDLLGGPRDVGIPLAVVLSFLRLATSPRVLSQPLTAEQACDCVAAWFRSRFVRLITPGGGHLGELLEEVRRVGVAGNLTTDAHLAALSREYHAEIHSADVDFARFPGIRWKNPLKGKRS
jgi:toxin-antitoxin system PIN domain toxin